MNPQKVHKWKESFLEQRYLQEILAGSVGFSSLEYESQIEKLVEAEESFDVIYNSKVTEWKLKIKYLRELLLKIPRKFHYTARNFIDATFKGFVEIVTSKRIRR